MSFMVIVSLVAVAVGAGFLVVAYSQAKKMDQVLFAAVGVAILVGAGMTFGAYIQNGTSTVSCPRMFVVMHSFEHNDTIYATVLSSADEVLLVEVLVGPSGILQTGATYGTNSAGEIFKIESKKADSVVESSPKG